MSNLRTFCRDLADSGLFGNGRRPHAGGVLHSEGKRLKWPGPLWFEAPWAQQRLGLVWIPFVLLATLIIPGPYVGFQWPLMERAIPLFWLLAAGVILACARIARASIPLALLILWAGFRAMYHAFPLRSLQVLLLFLMAGLLYAAARDLSDRHARFIAWAWLIGVGYEWVLGLLNAFRIYPFMSWIAPEHVGKGMGFLTHPNYWGSFMALGLHTLITAEPVFRP